MIRAFAAVAGWCLLAIASAHGQATEPRIARIPAFAVPSSGDVQRTAATEHVGSISRLPKPRGDVAKPKLIMHLPEVGPLPSSQQKTDRTPDRSTESSPSRRDETRIRRKAVSPGTRNTSGAGTHADGLKSTVQSRTASTSQRRWSTQQLFEREQERNRRVGPLSGKFDFDQSMEAVEDAGEQAWRIPPPGVGNVTLPPMVAMQAERVLNDAVALADRGAIYAANRQFLRVMRMITQALDSQLGQQFHTRALASGLRALEEADDFAISTANRVEDDVHLATFVNGHRTPVLKGADLSQFTSLRAMQYYYEYAREQLTLAGGNSTLASRALFALGRAEMLLSTEQEGRQAGAPQSLALFHAALQTDPGNARAANELAVMVARRGRLEEAADILSQGMAVSPTPAVAANLAKIFQRMGDPRAVPMRQMAERLAKNGPPVGRAARVLWVEPQAFDAAADAPVQPIAAVATPNHGSHQASYHPVSQNPMRPMTPNRQFAPAATTWW